MTSSVLLRSSPTPSPAAPRPARHRVLLITNGESLTSSTGNWLGAHKANIDKNYVIGGPVSVTPDVMTQIEARLQ